MAFLEGALGSSSGARRSSRICIIDAHAVGPSMAAISPPSLRRALGPSDRGVKGIATLFEAPPNVSSDAGACGTTTSDGASPRRSSTATLRAESVGTPTRHGILRAIIRRLAS